MSREEAMEKSIKSLLKCFLLVLIFGLVAMPPAGIYLAVTRKSIPGKALGIFLLFVAVAAWIYLFFYSIRPH